MTSRQFSNFFFSDENLKMSPTMFVVTKTGYLAKTWSFPNPNQVFFVTKLNQIKLKFQHIHSLHKVTIASFILATSLNSYLKASSCLGAATQRS